MLTLNQTAGNNSATIWMIKILTDTPIYLSTKDITLDNTYDGQVLQFDNYLSDLVQGSTIESSGGTGIVTSISISISRYTNNSSTDGFFNEFYPATSGIYLSGVPVQFGICWEGATADTDITWLFLGRIVDYNYDQRKLNLTIFQESEVSNKELPYYEVQKDFDNEISYYPTAPEESFGRRIPIVYGNFSRGAVIDFVDYGRDLGLVAVSPCIPVSKRSHKFIACSHKAYEISQDVASLSYYEYLYKYIPEVEAYIGIRNNDINNSTSENLNTKFVFTMMGRAGTGASILYGYMMIRLVNPSPDSDIEAIDEAVDRDITTYLEINAGETIALQTLGSPSTNSVGILNPANTGVGLWYRVSTDGGGNRNYSLDYINNGLLTPAGSATPSTGTLVSATSSYRTHYFGTDTNGKSNADLPWTIEEVCSLDFKLTNTEVSAGNKIRVYNAVLYIPKIKIYTSLYDRSIVRNNRGGRR